MHLRLTTIDRYLFKEIAVPFAVGMCLFFVVVAFAQVLKVSDSITGLGVDGADIIRALLYSVPSLLGLLVPVSALFATLLGVGRLAADREILGLCAGGISPYALLRTPLLLALCLAAVSAVAVVVGEPWGLRGLRDLMKRSAQIAITQGIRVGEFNEWVAGVMFFASDDVDGTLHDVIFADHRNPEQSVVVSARRGYVEQGSEAQDIVLNLQDGIGVVHNSDRESDQLIHFDAIRYRIDVGRLVRRKARGISTVQGKDVATLWREGRDPQLSSGRRAHLNITLQRKLTIPLATVIFTLLAVPLACRSNASARARGFLYSSGLVGAYYYVGRALELSARSDGFPPILAAWTPDLLGIAGLAIMLVRLRRSAL